MNRIIVIIVLIICPAYLFGQTQDTLVVDVDGNTYSTLKIGNQIWMAENLRVSKYADGTPIPHITDKTEWAELPNNNTDEAKAYCWYDNNADSYKEKYGALYTYAAATNGTPYYVTIDDIQGVCPASWHIPSNSEWTELKNYISNNGHKGLEGVALKSTEGWDNDLNEPGNGTDNFGFSALAGGSREFDGHFSGSGTSSDWWSSTILHSSQYNDNDHIHAYFCSLTNYQNTMGHDKYYKSRGLYVRCLKDTDESKAQLNSEPDRTKRLLYWIENEYYEWPWGHRDYCISETSRHPYIDIFEKIYTDFDSLDFNELVDFEKHPNLKYEVKEIFKSDTVSLRLIAPTDSDWDTNCYDNKSYLNYKSKSQNQFIEIDLNPYCSESYAANEIVIALFRTSLVTNPILAIESNNPVCGPVDIYIFSNKTNRYEYVKELCLSQLKKTTPIQVLSLVL
jgi:uncharacterized protein (TIGR02145 family)